MVSSRGIAQRMTGWILLKNIIKFLKFLWSAKYAKTDWLKRFTCNYTSWKYQKILVFRCFKCLKIFEIYLNVTIFGISAHRIFLGTGQDLERGVIETDRFQNNSPRASIHYAMLSENDIEDGTNKSQSSSASQQILNEKKEKNRFFRSYSSPH